MAPDPRLVIGAVMYAEAKHIRTPIECLRKYGSLANSKMLDGTVTAVDRVLTNNRRSTWLTARFEAPDKVYIKRFSLMNFRAGPVPDPPAPSAPAQSATQIP
eukprot:contig_29748_g7297